MKTPPVFKRILFLLCFLSIVFTNAQTTSETVTIPDPNFEQALIDLGLDSDGIINQSVLKTDITPIEVLDVSNRNISSLEGLGAFTNLKYFYAYQNQIGSIDVSNLANLVHLSISNNNISQLNLVNNSKLEEVYINENQIVDLSLGSHPQLFNLHGGGNSLQSIDVSGCPNLQSLILWGSELTEINLGSNSELAELVLDDNSLNSLDVSNNPKLETLFCGSNNLTSLNIANGNNANFVSPDWNDFSFVANGNPQLACIQVDQGMVGNIPSDWGKDAGAIYSVDCATKPEYVSIPDASFEQALIDLGIDSDGFINSFVLINDVRNVEVLDIGNRNITSLEGLQSFENLKYLYAYNNQLTSLDVSENTQLIHLSLNNNQLTTLDLTNNSLLEEIHINRNSISNLILENHPNLWGLHAGGNGLDAIDVSNLPALKMLVLWENNLQELNLQSNLELEELYCDHNNLTSLDVSNNPKLKTLFVLDNKLTSLNVANGNNVNFVSPDWSEYSFVANVNPQLACIQVDAGMVEINHPDWAKDNGVLYSVDCATKPEYVNIPDPNFEQALIDLGIDSDGFVNSWLLRSDAENVTNLNLLLPVNFPYGGGNTMITNVNSSINDLTGIEAFTNLKELLVSFNNLKNIDLTNLGALSLLFANHNNLTQIDISQNPQLKYLSLTGNNLTQIDVTNNPKLESLEINNNQISQIDVSQNPLLKVLQFLGNPVGAIDTRQLTQLETLSCGRTNIATLDISNNLQLKNLNIDELPIDQLDFSIHPYLERLWARNTSLETLDFSKNPNLLQVWVEYSPLKTLDLSNNPGLFALVLDNNLALEHLDLRNGNNSNMNFFRTNNTPNLSCINADAEISQAMTDSGKNFSTDCGDFVEIPDPNFEQALIDIGIDSDGVIDGKILRSDAEAVTELNVTNPKFASDERYANQEIVNVNEKIQDLTGLEAFVNITKLSAWANALTQINVSKNTKLTTLELVNNKLSSIDVSNNPDLEILWLETNNLSQIDVSNNPNLLNIALGYNNISTIDISQNSVLYVLTIEGNDLTTVDVSNNPELKQIWVAENPNLTHMDFSKNPKLFGIGIYDTSISSLDLSNNPISRLYIGNNTELKHLDLRNGNNSNLNQFWADNTPNLTCINSDASISQAMIDSGKSFSEDCGDFIHIPDPNFEQALIDLGIDSDGVVNTSVLREDIENIEVLDVSNSDISSVEGLEAFTSLKEFYGYDNSLNSIDVTNLVNLRHLSIDRNNIPELDISNNTMLTELYASENALTTLNVGDHPDLFNLHSGGNHLSSIDVSGCPNLRSLILWGSNLTEIDLYSNPELVELVLDDNNIASLDISNNPKVIFVYIGSNALTSLNIANGNNANFVQPDWNDYSLVASGNPELQCIQVDPGMVLNIPSDWAKDAGAIYTRDCATKPEYVNVPDANFEQTLIDLGIDGDGVVNTWLLKVDAEAVTDLNLNNPLFDNSTFANPEIVNVSGKIANLSGIEAFVNLTSLEAAYGDLTTVDLSANTELEELFLNDNQLSGVDVSMLTNLKRFGVMRNPISIGLNLSNNLALEELFVHYTGINSIDLSANTNLWNLFIQNNNLSVLDLSSNTGLKQLRCQNNQIAQLDISSLTVIERIDAQYNPDLVLVTGTSGNPGLTSLNLSGTGLSNFNGAPYPNLQWLLLNGNSLSNFNGNNNLNLQNLFLNNNAISKLSLTGNSQLKQLQVMDNGLEELDLRNGNNAILNTMKATGNILTCMSVDDPTDSSLPYATWEVDPGVVLSSNCKQAEEVILIPDPNFEQALIDLGIDTNSENGALTGNIILSEAEAVSSLDVSGKSITNATGIEGFVNLTDLNISNNSLTEINLIENSSLVNLDVSDNGLIELLVGSGKNLLTLQAENNDLQLLNLADLTNLEVLDISGNLFGSINLSDLANLTSIDVSRNNLTELDLRNGNNSALTFMDATGNTLLLCIGVDDALNIPSGWSKDPATNYTNSGDCEAPEVLTKNITVSLDRYGLASISALDLDNGSSDNVSLQRDLIFEVSQSDFDCGNLGENEVVLTVSDEFGNTASAPAIITVIDEILPTASSLRSYQLDLAGAASVNLDPSEINDGSTDNCNELELAIDQSSFSFPGDYTVEFTVTDASGNSASSATDVQVVDSTTNPTSLKFPGNLVATVYPNPFIDDFYIAFSENIDLNTVIAQVYDMGGNLTGLEFQIDGNTLKSVGSLSQQGTYILRLTVNGQTRSAEILKE